MRPSDCPRDESFRDPTTTPFLEEHDGQVLAHVFSYEDVWRVLYNPDKVFSHDFRPLLPVEQMHPVWSFMWATDPGQHGRHDVLRGLVDDWFKRQAVNAMSGPISNLCHDLRKEIVNKGTGEFDMASEFAYRLSLRTICGIVGMPLDREDWVRRELERVVQATDIMELSLGAELESYFWEIVAKRAAHPGNDLIDRVVAGWRDGVIDDRELLGFLFGFYAAGTDTTGTAIVNAFALPAEFGVVDYLCTNIGTSTILHSAVEEIVRFATPFPTLMQVYAAEPVQLGGLKIPRYASMRAHIAAANRSPKINGGNKHATDPNELDLNRTPNRHLGFGWGIHRCLGGMLARLEVVTAWQELLTYLPGLTFDDGKPFVRYAGIVDGVTEAHFYFDQTAAERLISAA